VRPKGSAAIASIFPRRSARSKGQPLAAASPCRFAVALVGRIAVLVTDQTAMGSPMAVLGWADLTPFLCVCNLAIVAPILVVAEAVRKRDPKSFKSWWYAAVVLSIAFWLAACCIWAA
jgi:hypothetical protein